MKYLTRIYLKYYIIKNNILVTHTWYLCKLLLFLQYRKGNHKLIWINLQSTWRFIYTISYKINENFAAKTLCTLVISSGKLETKNVFFKEKQIVMNYILSLIIV